ncbi:hypothetical protein [Duganella radicis]|uniref:Uncharacterized protein n=1 Tax=Duganella radicis TaxID=551988 RepID=A0A6L6PFR2_9BURK|nr:hypothetical protein [Duganella radicis]MTV37559.1 hypothetical protein [Duganella radicis]
MPVGVEDAVCIGELGRAHRTGRRVQLHKRRGQQPPAILGLVHRRPCRNFSAYSVGNLSAEQRKNGAALSI